MGFAGGNHPVRVAIVLLQDFQFHLGRTPIPNGLHNLLLNPSGILVGHQPATDLYERFPRDYRFGALSLVTASHSIKFQRGRQPDGLKGVESGSGMKVVDP